jgi:GrpB-like predicted nucleotidyltransferase (UPF0157 family)
MTTRTSLITLERISRAIFVVRGQRVLLDRELAAIYGVSTGRLNQAANILSSPHAVAMGVYVVRAFVQLREVLASNKDLVHKLAALERSLAALDARTRQQFKDVYEAIRALMIPPASRRRGIGFTADLGDPGQ